MSEMASSWVDQMEARLVELRPLVVEHDRLVAALAVLTDKRRGSRGKRVGASRTQPPTGLATMAAKEAVADAAV